MTKFEEAQNDLMVNHKAYQQGRGDYLSGRSPNGSNYNYIRRGATEDVFCLFRVRVAAGAGASHSFWQVVDRVILAEPRDVSREPTWCNQWVSRMAQIFYGVDLDIVGSKEFPANEVIKNLKAKKYDNADGVWVEADSHGEALTAADSGCLVVATLLLDPIGHVAVLRPDGDLSQAGPRGLTGIKINKAAALGRYNGTEKYFILDLAAVEAEAEEEDSEEI